MNREGCPVCGYKEIGVLDEFDCTTFEICSSCGNESGCDYDLESTQEQFLRLRTDWGNHGSQWFGVNGDKPLNWSSHQQMRKAGLEYPKIPTIMAFFHLGLIDDKYSKNWADQNLESKNDKFEYLSELSLHGAKYCTDKTRDHYPPKRVFNIYEEFSLRTHSLDFS